MAAGAALLPAASRIALAQTYPARPIIMIVPNPAGGATDTIARILAEHMRASLSQPVLIENVSGATGSIGVGRAARSAPNGYTLSVGTLATHVFNGAIYALPYDAVADFEPVSLLATQPDLIVGRQSLPATSLQELLGWLRANPNRALQGTGGTGSIQQIGGVLFQDLTGTRLQFVPYRGAAPAMQALVAGQIDVMIGGTISDSLPHIRAGTVRAYAVMGERRAAAMPEIPTVDEAGLPQFHLTYWLALWAPKRTPKSIVVRLNAAVVDALADSAVRQRLGDLGVDIPARDRQTPEALATLQKAEIEKWWPIIKAAGIKGE